MATGRLSNTKFKITQFQMSYARAPPFFEADDYDIFDGGALPARRYYYKFLTKASKAAFWVRHFDTTIHQLSAPVGGMIESGSTEIRLPLPGTKCSFSSSTTPTELTTEAAQLHRRKHPLGDRTIAPWCCRRQD